MLGFIGNHPPSGPLTDPVPTDVAVHQYPRYTDLAPRGRLGRLMMRFFLMYGWRVPRRGASLTIASEQSGQQGGCPTPGEPPQRWRPDAISPKSRSPSSGFEKDSQMTQPSMDRTRRYRQRKQTGAVCVGFEVEPDAITALVDLGWLPADEAADPGAVTAALLDLAGKALVNRLAPSA